MQNICIQMTRKAWLALILVLVCALPALAQKITVTGTVYDPEGEPAIGASVAVHGHTNVGVVTDYDGNYTIQVDPNASLVFSYIGCDPVTEAVNGRTKIDVHFAANSVALNEVVAIGYGTVKKSDATGSVAIVKPDEIEAGLATSVQDMLVGQTPGVVVTTGGGPEGKADIRIRGGASLSASNDPLIVIDGVPLSNDGVLGMSNPLAMISPENIESMTILKDASATAIYGSRASNGVIIITTKKGQSGRPQVSFSANMYVDYTRNRWDVMNASEYRNFIANDPRFGENSAAYTTLGDADTNWQDEVFRTSISSDYTLSVGGTAGFMPYRASVSYTNSNGIVRTTSMDRLTVGFNLTPKFFDDHLAVNANAKGYYIKNNFADDGGAIGAAVSFDPTAPIYSNLPVVGGDSGEKFLFGGYYQPYSTDASGVTQLLGDAVYNPVATLHQAHSHANVLRSNGNLQLDYSLHFLPELHLNLNLGYDITRSNNWYNVAANSVNAWKNHSNYGGAYGEKSFQSRSNTLLDFYLNYKKEFAVIKSIVDATAGYSWQRFAAHGWNLGSNSESGIAMSPALSLPVSDGQGGWILNTRQVEGLELGQPFKPDASSPTGNYHWRNHLQLLSFFGRLNYTLMDRYLLTFTLRGDATSRFSKDNRWGVFPAVALGWKINDEAFMTDAQGWLTDLKLRLGWGQTGQQEVGNLYNYYALYTPSSAGSYYPNGQGGWAIPYFPEGFNPNLKWETTTTWNVALDYGFLGNRINGSIEYYLRKTKDLLANVAVAAGSSTVNRLDQNIGNMENYGIEFNISAKPIVTNDFTWTLQYNIGWNHNEITNLDGNTFEVGGGFGGTGGDCQIQKEGYPAYSFYLYQQVYDEAGKPIEGAYVDQNADGIIDGRDRIIEHSRDPKVTMTFGSQFRYKQWDFGFSLRSSLGNYVYAAALRGGTTIDGIYRNGHTNIFNADQYFNNDTSLSDYWLRNASYLRCDNITLGYTFDGLLRDQLRLRLFAGVQNPFVITKYDGLDPEVFSGVDGNSYPRATSWTFGLVANF